MTKDFLTRTYWVLETDSEKFLSMEQVGGGDIDVRLVDEPSVDCAFEDKEHAEHSLKQMFLRNTGGWEFNLYFSDAQDTIHPAMVTVGYAIVREDRK